MMGGLPRRSFLALTAVAARSFLVLAAAAALGIPGAVRGDGNPTVDLRVMLEKGLKARRPVEFQFVNRVIELVDAGVLPEKTVQTTFLWARKQRKHPFQYFQRAIRIRAGQLGITL